MLLPFLTKHDVFEEGVALLERCMRKQAAAENRLREREAALTSREEAVALQEQAVVDHWKANGRRRVAVLV